MSIVDTAVCPFCSEEIQAQARKCRHCGEWLYCTNCGAEASGGTPFCPACGVAKAVVVAGSPLPAPQQVSAAPSLPVTDQYGGFWVRVVASVIDGIVLMVGIVLLSLITLGLGLIFGVAVGWLYFALFESSEKQATPGKMAMGLVVADALGRRISFGQASGRYFAKILSALVIDIGFIMVAFTEKKQGLHDMLANTLVVHKM